MAESNIINIVNERIMIDRIILNLILGDEKGKKKNILFQSKWTVFGAYWVKSDTWKKE